MRVPLAAAIVIILVVVGASVVVSGLRFRPQTVTSSSSTSISESTSQTTSSSTPNMCSQSFPVYARNQTTLANGTVITDSASPALVMSAGSTMAICVSYRDAGSSSVTTSGSASYWYPNGDFPLPPVQNVKVSETPGQIPSGGQSTVIEYKVAAAHNATGFYKFSMTGACFQLPLAIGLQPSQVNSSDFPGFWNPCASSGGFTLLPQIIGYSGASIASLTNETRVNIQANVTDISVNSFPTAQGAENVTWTMNVQSFSYPLTVGLSLDQSNVRVTDGNPFMTPTHGGDYCDWDGSNETALSSMISTTFTKLPTNYMKVNAPVLQLGTYSKSTYSISLLISGPISSYTGLEVFFFTQVPGGTQGLGSLGTNFPVSVSGQLQTVSGPCLG